MLCSRPRQESLLKLAGIAVALFLMASQSQATPTWTSIDYPGADLTVAAAINNNGVIVGRYKTGGSDLFHGFVLSGGTYTTLDYPGSTQSEIDSITDTGLMVGTYFDASFNYHGYLYDGQTFTSLDYPGFGPTVATGVNSSGEVVGAFADNHGAAHGFTYTNGVYAAFDPPRSNFTIPAAIDNLGNISGYFTNPNSQIFEEGFVLTVGGSYRYIVYPGAATTEIRGMNDKRQLVGIIGDGFGGVASFINRNGQFQKIAYPGSTRTDASGIDNAGEVVGDWEDATTAHGFLRTP